MAEAVEVCRPDFQRTLRLKRLGRYRAPPAASRANRADFILYRYYTKLDVLGTFSSQVISENNCQYREALPRLRV